VIGRMQTTNVSLLETNEMNAADAEGIETL
jgi:hypothetical protein